MSPARIVGPWCASCGKRPTRPPTDWCVQCLATRRPLSRRVVEQAHPLLSGTPEFDAALKAWLEAP